MDHPTLFLCCKQGLPLGWGQPGHLCKFLGTMMPLHRLGTAGQGGPPAQPPGRLAEHLLCAGTQGRFTCMPWDPRGPACEATTLRHMEAKPSTRRRGTPTTRGAETPCLPCGAQLRPVFLQPQPGLPPTPRSHWKLIGHCPARGDLFPLSRVDIQAQSCRDHSVPGPSQRPGPTSPAGGAPRSLALPGQASAVTQPGGPCPLA